MEKEKVNVLLVVDMQNDFISEEAKAIVPGVAERIRSFDGMVIMTKDCHVEYAQYPEHCIAGTHEVRTAHKPVPADTAVSFSIDL